MGTNIENSLDILKKKGLENDLIRSLILRKKDRAFVLCFFDGRIVRSQIG